jgi:hypothetical protein
MTSLQNEIADLLEDYLGLFDNHAGLQICWYPDGTINISGKWPEYSEADDICIGVCAEFTSVEDMIKILGIISVDQIHLISANTLLDLYHTGNAEIYCCIEQPDVYCLLYFRKITNEIWAKDEADQEHMVPVKLETPEDFVGYICQMAGVDLAVTNY